MQQTVEASTLIQTENRGIVPFDEQKLRLSIMSTLSDIKTINLEEFIERAVRSIKAKDTYKSGQISNLLILNALENIDMQEPDWTFAASRISLNRLYKKASMNRGYDTAQKYGPLYKLIELLTNEGIYGSHLLNSYTRSDIDSLSNEIEPERDKLFTYIGLKTLADRYLAKDHAGNVYELPQERWMIIAMHLMQNENPARRLDLVKEAYWALSNLYMTVATPTLSNSGKSYGQLSSCFIDTVDDSLRGIYDSNTDVATLSKGGGGIN